METLQEFRTGDGAHRGLTDWYPNKQKALAAALAAGKPFDTGWYGSKHEIASARVYSQDGKTILVEASVSDDFDTPGNGNALVDPRGSLEAVSDAIDRAWGEAVENQKENRTYYGFSIFTGKRTPRWVETLILQRGDGAMMEGPGGDNYHAWGFQGDIRLSRATKDKLEDCAHRLISGKTQDKSFTVGKYTIKPWED